MKQRKFFPSKKQLIVFILIIIGTLIVTAVIYQRTSLWKPEESLITLLPDRPICYLSLKELGNLVETFERSEFGKRTAQMPILSEMQQTLWWRLITYQKQLWEYEMGGVLDLKVIKGYFGEEAIVALYKRGDAISFLIISAVGAKEKLEIAAITATDFVNPKYKRIQENYREFTVNTITGYPLDFSYAFIGKIGLLTLDKSLIKDTIDIFAAQKQNFTNQHTMGKYLRHQYETNKNTIYMDFPQLAQSFEFGKQFKPLLNGLDVWTFSNRYENGTIHSQHRLTRREGWQPGERNTQSINQLPLSILPAKTALMSVSHYTDLSAFWKWLGIIIETESTPSEKFDSYIENEIILALLSSESTATMAIPSVILMFPIADRAGLETDLAKLKAERISINGKPLQFLPSQDYHGVQIYPTQLRLGLLFSLKGGYTIVDNYWIVSTTLAGLKSTIDTAIGQSTALANVKFPSPSNQPKAGYILVQPSYFIPEIKRLIPIAGLIASASGQKVDVALTKRVMDNIFPLEALGAISVDIEFDQGSISADVKIVLEE